MNRKEAQTLFNRYLEDKCSRSEVEQLLALLEQGRLNEEFSQVLGQIMQTNREPIPLQEAHKLALLNSINQNIKPTRQIVFLPVLKVAATLILIAAFSWLAYTYIDSASTTNLEHVLEKVVPEGQKSTVVLPDGSTVRLNAGSRLSYPEKFSADSRQVSLDGEGFFEVKEDADRPFTVLTTALETRVLGTSFNIKSMSGEANTVTVSTGRVRVTSIENKNQVVEITTGLQAKLEAVSGILQVNEVDLDANLAWKDNIILFDGEDEQEVLKVLSRWYGVSFEIVGQKSEPWDFLGKFNDKSLEEVLNSAGFAVGFTYIIEDKIVTITYPNP